MLVINTSIKFVQMNRSMSICVIYGQKTLGLPIG